MYLYQVGLICLPLHPILFAERLHHAESAGSLKTCIWLLLSSGVFQLENYPHRERNNRIEVDIYPRWELFVNI